MNSYERHRIINGKTYRSPMRGGWGYYIENGKPVQSKECWFPIICDHFDKKAHPMQICNYCAEYEASVRAPD